MIKSILIGGVVLSVILVGVFFFVQPETELAESQPSADNQAGPPPATTSPDVGGGGETYVVLYGQDNAYSPGELTVPKGATVTFRNESSREIWPASAIHPAHTAYPESDIQKCFDGSDRTVLFDACEEIAPGQEWSFVFKEIGTWRYHDHLNPTATGAITVEE